LRIPQDAFVIEYESDIPEAEEDPLSLYARMHAECAIHSVKCFEPWALTGSSFAFRAGLPPVGDELAWIS